MSIIRFVGLIKGFSKSFRQFSGRLKTSLAIVFRGFYFNFGHDVTNADHPERIAM